MMIDNELLRNVIIEAAMLKGKIDEHLNRISKTTSPEHGLKLIEFISAMETRLKNLYIYIGQLAVAAQKSEQKELFTTVQAVRVTYKPSGLSVIRKIADDSYYAARDTALFDLIKQQFGDIYTTIPFSDFETTWLYDWKETGEGVD